MSLAVLICGAGLSENEAVVLVISEAWMASHGIAKLYPLHSRWGARNWAMAKAGSFASASVKGIPPQNIVYFAVGDQNFIFAIFDHL
jgi:hypothetical protein